TQAGANIHLARIDGDGPIGMHGEETVDLFQVKRLPEIGAGARFLCPAALRQGHTEYKAHNDRAPSPEQVASGYNRYGVHDGLPYAWAARSTACRMRVWVPHLHR